MQIHKVDKMPRRSRRNAVNDSAGFDPKTVVVIKYTNYRGETSERQIVPREIRFASTEWHPEPQWILDAFDLDRQADRSFALRDILEWKR